MKILLPIDGSEYSKNAIDFVASRTTVLGNNPTIELLNIQVPLPARASRLVGREALDRYYEEEADKVFTSARKVLKRDNITVTEAYRIGAPDEMIARSRKVRRRPDRHGFPRSYRAEGTHHGFRHDRCARPHEVPGAPAPRQGSAAHGRSPRRYRC